MHPRSRNVLFAIVIALFVLVAPLIILFATGYSFKSENLTVVRTGIILIDTNVPKVTVTVDKEEPRLENDPVVLRNLEPGTYHIKLAREGFSSWEADLPVKAELITRVDNLILTYAEPKVQQPIKDPVGQFAVSPNSRYIAYTVTTGKDAGLWLHTSGEEKNRLLADVTQFDPAATREVRWSQNSRLLLLRDKDGNYLRIEPHVGTPVLVALNALKKMESSDVQLDQDEPTVVYFRDKNQKVFRWRTDRADTEPELITTKAVAMRAVAPKIFTLRTSVNGLELHSFDVRENTPQDVVIASLPTIKDGALIAESASQLALLSDKTLWLLKRTNGEFGFEKISDSVDSAKWSPDSDLLYFAKGQEVWVHDLDPLQDEPADYLIAHLNAVPDSVRWHDDGRHLIALNQDASGIHVTLLHVSRTAPQAQSLGTITTKIDPQFMRNGADIVYLSDKPAGLVIQTITEEKQ